MDFEQLSSDCGPHYVEFIRELSIQCRNRGLVLSIANYVPFNFNDYYRLDIQGQVADYVITWDMTNTGTEARIPEAWQASAMYPAVWTEHCRRCLQTR